MPFEHFTFLYFGYGSFHICEVESANYIIKNTHEKIEIFLDNF